MYPSKFSAVFIAFKYFFIFSTSKFTAVFKIFSFIIKISLPNFLFDHKVKMNLNFLIFLQKFSFDFWEHDWYRLYQLNFLNLSNIEGMRSFDDINLLHHEFSLPLNKVQLYQSYQIQVKFFR